MSIGRMREDRGSVEILILPSFPTSFFLKMAGIDTFGFIKLFGSLVNLLGIKLSDSFGEILVVSRLEGFEFMGILSV